MHIQWLLSVGLTWLIGYTAASYHEQLHLQPLPQSALLAAFNFQSNTTLSAFEQQNYNLFPRSLGQILQHTHAKELHLRFALGRWDAENWGARPRGGRREGGTGVELWAWVEADTDEEANARWLTLVNALSGLFCASLNFIDATKTIRPRSSFEFEGTMQKTDKLHLLHGALPHEVVCTENLTPFLKLLPCKGKAGISSLLDGHKLFDASWQTMAVDVRPVCPSDGSECLLEIEQTVDMVLDIERSMRPAKDPIPRPPPMESIACNTSKSYHAGDTCFPEIQSGERAWSMKEVFGTAIHGGCLHEQSDSDEAADVHLHVPTERQMTVDSADGFKELKSPNNPIRTYRLPATGDFDLRLDAYPTQPDSHLEKPLLYAERTFTGHGQQKGGMHAVLTNPSLTSSVEIVYLESLPWFMKPYLHTLTAVITPQTAFSTNTTAHSSSSSATSANPILSTLYRPGIDRHRGTHIELTLHIPPASTLTLAYDFDKAILRYTEYPPDANRGFDVAPAVIRVLPPTTPSHRSSADGETIRERGRGTGESTYLRTTSLLLPLPTPDFSMPYNVIILTSTVIAMGFGSIFNLLVRRFVGADEVEDGGLAAVRERVRARLGALGKRLGIGGGKTGSGGGKADAKEAHEDVRGSGKGGAMNGDEGGGGREDKKRQ